MKIQNLLFFLALFLVMGCKKTNNGDINLSIESQVLLSPDEIMINDEETGSVFLTVQPAQKFEWSISFRPDWIEVTPSSGIVDDEIIELKVKKNETLLSQGKHNGKIEIITNGAGIAEVDVTVCVDARPIIAVEPTNISFLENESQKVIRVSNLGTGFLNWEIKGIPSWLGLSNSSGTLDEGRSINITATAIRDDLPIGEKNAQLIISSNSFEEGDIPIDVSLEVGELPVMTISESNLDIGFFDDVSSFTIKNEGNIPFNWMIDNVESYMSFSSNSGTLAVNDSVEIELIIDRSQFSSPMYNHTISINNNKEQTLNLPITISHFQEEKWLIDGQVVDAEYDRNTDELIVITESPNEIRKYNVASETSQSLTLNVPPTCVSISTDGNFAAVGHNGSFAYVDLNAMELVKTYAVTADAFDIVLADNGWVYVFPRKDQWETIRCIELATGIEKDHIGLSIYDETRAKLHPSGDYIYGANNGLSPSDFEKYDIRNGVAEYMYDSPYHGNFAFSGNIWIPEDGSRLFARSRNVFNASTNQDNDMTYNGELAGERANMATMDYSANTKKVYAIFYIEDRWSTPANEIRIYDSEFLAFQGTKELPKFLLPDGAGGARDYNSQGHYGFFNAAGTEFYVLLKIDDPNLIENEWAITTIEVD